MSGLIANRRSSPGEPGSAWLGSFLLLLGFRSQQPRAAQTIPTQTQELLQDKEALQGKAELQDKLKVVPQAKVAPLGKRRAGLQDRPKAELQDKRKVVLQDRLKAGLLESLAVPGSQV